MFEWETASAEIKQQSIEEIEEEFNNVVREYIINLLTFVVLFLFSYVVVASYHQKKERVGLYAEDEDAKAYRISFYLCTFSLSVSFGSVLMLPMSMLGNEVVHLYPDSYWVQWLNGALVHTFWKWIFILSNTSLFVLLPFSYFFTESEGFTGQRRGLMPRVYETITVLLLLAAVVFGLAVLALAFVDNDDSAQDILMMVGEYYLQYLYSFLICACVIFMLAACAPFGFTILFDSVGHLLVKPKIFENNESKIETEEMEENALKIKLTSESSLKRITSEEKASLVKKLESVKQSRKKLERRKKASAFERNLAFPLTMLILLALTALALFLVSIHVLKLVFIGDHELHPSTVWEDYRKDYRSINIERKVDGLFFQKDAEADVDTHWWWKWKFWSSKQKEKEAVLNSIPTPAVKSHMYSLGANSLSSFGIVGTILEVCVIFYLLLASVVGLYNLPGFRLLKPQVQETTMTKIILNCLVLQLIGPSLPVLSRVLGITDFDLQGNFGKFYWLGNFYIVLSFNVIFAITTALCLVNKMTSKMRRELLKALQSSAVLISEKLSKKHEKVPGTPVPKSKKVKTMQSSPETSANSSVSAEAMMKKSPLLDSQEQLETLTESLHIDNKCTFLCTPSRKAALTVRKRKQPIRENGHVTS
ncbi:limb region 1 protein homolog [Clavelina lepadiformis]|uniref:limb region 1 protein homolog n=1 Tax=Clavelina lepadiformis TaxID=159417 RepID=UPI004042FFF7